MSHEYIINVKQDRSQGPQTWLRYGLKIAAPLADEELFEEELSLNFSDIHHPFGSFYVTLDETAVLAEVYARLPELDGSVELPETSDPQAIVRAVGAAMHRRLETVSVEHLHALTNISN